MCLLNLMTIFFFKVVIVKVYLLIFRVQKFSSVSSQMNTYLLSYLTSYLPKHFSGKTRKTILTSPITWNASSRFIKFQLKSPFYDHFDTFKWKDSKYILKNLREAKKQCYFLHYVFSDSIMLILWNWMETYE